MQWNYFSAGPIELVKRGDFEGSSAKFRGKRVGDSLSTNVDDTQPLTTSPRIFTKCSKCKDGDILWTRKSSPAFECCGAACHKYWCLTPTTEDCKTFAGAVGADSARATTPYKSGLTSPDHRITCTYNMNKMAANDRALIEWNAHRNPSDKWDNTLMTQLCGQDDACPSGNGETCPKMMTRSSCKEWAESNSGKASADQVMINWCASHPTSSACECINRTNNKVYKDFEGKFPFNDGCWYSPCKDKEMSTKLVPSPLRHPDTGCPAKVCEQIVNIANNQNLDLSGLKMYMDCSGNDNKDNTTPNLTPAQWAMVGVGGGVTALGVGLLIYIALK